MSVKEALRTLRQASALAKNEAARFEKGDLRLNQIGDFYDMITARIEEALAQIKSELPNAHLPITDDDLAEFGWMPGGYACTCWDCGENPLRSDTDLPLSFKRSIRCRACAVALASK